MGPFQNIRGGPISRNRVQERVPLKVVELISTEKKGSQDIKRP